MGKFKISSQTDQVHKYQKRSPPKKKSISKKKSDRNNEVGKPKHLNEIFIDKPDIWTIDKISINLIRLLLKKGRFLSYHLAGVKKQKKKKEEQKNEKDKQIEEQKKQKEQSIKAKKAIYEFIEKFSINNLGMPQGQTKKARLTVFFFRHGCLKATKQLFQQTNNEILDWQGQLKKFYFLLSIKFYQELKLILEQIFDENQEPIDIADRMLESIKPIQQADEILKCLFVQQIKEENITINELYQLNGVQLQEKFEDTVLNLKNELIQFLKNIKNIFEGSDNVDEEYQYIDDENIWNDNPYRCYSYYSNYNLKDIQGNIQ